MLPCEGPVWGMAASPNGQYIARACLGHVHILNRLEINMLQGDLAAVQRQLGNGMVLGDVHARDTGGNTALHLAYQRWKSPQLVGFLLARGADPTMVNAEGIKADATSALIIEMRDGFCGGADWLQYLVSQHADVTVADVDADGNTALHRAALLGHEEAWAVLLRANAPLDKVNADAKRPLDLVTDSELRFRLNRAAGRCDVFISYSHRDRAVALRLRELFRASHVTVWMDLMDPFGIEAGTVWRDEIGEAIAQAEVLVAVLSSTFVTSTFCTNELALARKLHKAILPCATEAPLQLGSAVQDMIYSVQIVPFESAIE